MFARFLTGTFLLGLGLLLSGCGHSALGPQGEVSGKVMYKGAPLPGGQVTFVTSKGYTFSSVIDPEGTYKVKAVVGEARIAVDNHMLIKSDGPPRPSLTNHPGMQPPAGVKVDEEKSSAPTITGTYVSIPEKYRSPDSSGLTYAVQSGSQTHDIELSDNP